MISNEKIEGILRDAIIHHAKLAGLRADQVQLIITTENDTQATPIYKVLHDYIFKKVISFKEIYWGLMASMAESKSKEILATGLKKMAAKFDALPSEIRIMVMAQESSASKIYYIVDVKKNNGEKSSNQMKLEQIIQN